MKSKTACYWAIGLALLSAIPMLQPIHDADIFWHLNLGRIVLETQSRVFPESSAFPAFTNLAVAPEWLWELTLYGVYRLGDETALAIFTLVIAALCAVTLVWCLLELEPKSKLIAIIPLSLLVMALELSRIRLRPEAIVFPILLLFIVTTTKCIESNSDKRRRWGIALIALQILWAQVHGSFVLGPAILGIMSSLHALQRRHFAILPFCSILFAALLLSSLSSAHGLGTIEYIWTHSAGDGQQHITDMQAPDWQSLNPITTPFYAIYFALWIIALLGAIENRRFKWEYFGIAVLGLALATNAVRFVATAGILLAPLALEGAIALQQRFSPNRLCGGIAIAAASGLFLASGAALHHFFGPIGSIGFSDAASPKTAAIYLRTLPSESRIFSTMTPASALSFLLAGQARTFVDGRTPLYFDDTDFALARDAWSDPISLQSTLTHYSVDAIVIERDLAICRHLEQDWVPVVVEPRFSTFVRRGQDQGLEKVAACGNYYLANDACIEGGAALQRDIERMARLRESSFLDYLRASKKFYCERDASAARELLPTRQQAWDYRKQRALLEAQILLIQEDIPSAISLLRKAVRKGDEDAMRLLLPWIMAEKIPAEEGKQLLAAFVDARSDLAPVDIRSALAQRCMRLEDAECVRFHGMRAALRGDAAAAQLLPWLAEHHPAERVRREAQAWHEKRTQTKAPE